MLVLTILFMNGSSLGIQAMARTMGYENRLFDHTKVHTIDIVMNDWEEFIANATGEEYYVANVVIDGEYFKNVGIRAKGNTSLSTVASLGSERYSFKIEFDHYDSTGSYHGLDKLSLNNLIQDSTMMKDYLTYTMMNTFGVNSSLCSFVYITVNGEDWGLYLAVEGVEESFLERNYGSDYGELYKPDSMSFGGGRGNGRDFDMEDFDFNVDGVHTDSSQADSTPDRFNPSMSGGSRIPDMPPVGETGIPGDFSPDAGVDGKEGRNSGFGFGEKEGGNGGFRFDGGSGMGSSDVKLQYIDDDPDSYSNIWNNAKTDITDADQRRLIESLKKLSDGEDIESVVDVEQVIRYFVVHNYVCNDDSYTGMMVHNYYLYEKDGQLAMIPWDYNLGFGTFGGGDATGTVNTPIDSPVSGGSSDRPMLDWIYENEKYTELYHQYFSEFLDTVDITGMIEDAYQLIRSYVEKDPTAFYSYEEFETGVETLRRFCNLRSESISMQLESGETVNPMDYADASDIILSDMGSMGGGNMPMPGGDMPTPSGDMPVLGGDMPATGGNMPDAPDSAALPEGFDPSALPDNFPPGFPGQSPDGHTGTVPPDGSGATEDTNHNSFAGGTMSAQSSNMPAPDGMPPWDGSDTEAALPDPAGWNLIAVSAVILAAGLIAAKKYGH